MIQQHLKHWLVSLRKYLIQGTFNKAKPARRLIEQHLATKQLLILSARTLILGAAVLKPDTVPTFKVEEASGKQAPCALLLCTATFTCAGVET